MSTVPEAQYRLRLQRLEAVGKTREEEGPG